MTNALSEMNKNQTLLRENIVEALCPLTETCCLPASFGFYFILYCPVAFQIKYVVCNRPV